MDWGEGAGFINDSIAEEPQQVTGNVQIGGDDKNKLVASVSVSQICKLTRPNEGLIIHGKKIYHINLVAYVHEIVDVNHQKVHLMVDDHSGGGPLEVSHIIGDVSTPGEDGSLSMFQDHIEAMDHSDGSDRPRDLQMVRPGDYVRCIGVVKFTQDKANVIAYHLKIVEDPNEVTMHIVEVIHNSLFYQKLQASGGVLPTIQPTEKPTALTNQQQQVHNQAPQSEFGKLTTRDKHVITFLKNKAGDKGMHIDDIAKNFAAFNRTEILDSLSTLSNEGLCWQSDDENVWCVDSM